MLGVVSFLTAREGFDGCDASSEGSPARRGAQAQASRLGKNVVNSYICSAQRNSMTRNKAQAEAHVAEFKALAQKAQADLKAKADDLSKAGQASWAAMSQALDESRNASPGD
jgi:hypothetical protein